MHLASVRLHLLISATGTAYLAAVLVLVASEAPLGSPLFFTTAAVTIGAYSVLLARVWRAGGSRRLLWLAFGFALAFRIPPALGPVGPDSDMMRYIWDGRVQRFGHNPYQVVPADPSLVYTHTAETATMPSRRARTPYPPAAQLFFRLVVSIHDSPITMKLALLACDLLALLVVWRWLLATGRNEWLSLAYAWSPLVVLEAAHSSHIDVLGALWIAASAYWLARRRTALATIAYVLAVATKLLPIVLAPIFVGRIRRRDAIAGAALAVLLYLPFTQGTDLPLGSVPNVVEHIRFNGPIFRSLAWMWSPRTAAAAAVLLGVAVSAWARWRRPATDPVAWAWPMAVSLACAPVVYPWYLLYLTPFLVISTTFPLTAWTFSVFIVYIVWAEAREGGRWVVPGWALVIEYGALLAAALIAASYAARDRAHRKHTHPGLR